MLLEIKGLGYTGSLSHLGRLLTEWRRTGRPAATAEATMLPLGDPSTGYLVLRIDAAALCVKPRGMLTTKQAVTVDAFKASSTDFAAMRALAMRFRLSCAAAIVRSSPSGYMTPITRPSMAFDALPRR